MIVWPDWLTDGRGRTWRRRDVQVIAHISELIRHKSLYMQRVSAKLYMGLTFPRPPQLKEERT
jgi:hypothetical protein